MAIEQIDIDTVAITNITRNTHKHTCARWQQITIDKVTQNEQYATGIIRTILG